MEDEGFGSCSEREDASVTSRDRMESSSDAASSCASSTSLPVLTNVPTYHPSCCVALSTTLITALLDQLSDPQSDSANYVLSIGSGSGLFEALIIQQNILQQRGCRRKGGALRLQGVEIAGPSCPNIYLGPAEILEVPTSSALVEAETALETTALLFVYPRSPVLIGKYLDFCLRAERQGGTGLRRVLWLSHRSDWEEYQALFEAKFRDVVILDEEESGTTVHEMLVVATHLSEDL